MFCLGFCLSESKDCLEFLLWQDVFVFQFLQKIYREDLDEMLDEAEYLMGKNRDAAKEMVRKPEI